MSDLIGIGARMRRNAMANVCTDPAELTNPDLSYQLDLGLKYHAVVVCALQVTREVQRWHLAIMFRRGAHTVFPGDWTREQKVLARNLYRKLLGGAGKQGIDHEGWYEMPMGIRFEREASDKDRAQFAKMLEEA